MGLGRNSVASVPRESEAGRGRGLGEGRIAEESWEGAEGSAACEKRRTKEKIRRVGSRAGEKTQRSEQES